ncbi:hypothetical protein MW887_005951 [Aspergillus wentii]|nr:hypothetical protein MW887_005951 [Aspergillus wentii]
MASCSWKGNADLYGVGVRVGLYAQWVATLVVTLFNTEEEETFRIVNLLVQSSLFLGLCQQATELTKVIEPVITLFLLCGSLSSLTGDGITHFSHVSGIFRITFYLALTSYSCWFWFIGVDRMRNPACDEIAFFGHSLISGWFRSLAKTLSIIGLIACVCLIGISAVAVMRRFRNGFEASFAASRPKRGRVEISLLFFSIGLIIFSIWIIEYLIRVNQVTGLSDFESAGQLIPLLIGGMSCLSVMRNVLVGGMLWRRRCWFLLNWHL